MKKDKKETIENLKRYLRKGDSLFTTTAGRTGNTERAKTRVKIMQIDNEFGPDVVIRDLTHLVARACGWRTDKNGHLLIQGGGMCMQSEVVFVLGHILYGDEKAFICRKL